MMTGLTRTVNEFGQAMETVTEPELLAWAENTLPMLQEQLDLAKGLEAVAENET